MTKMTNKNALTYVLENYGADIPDDVREKLEGMITQLEKKSGAERKPTEKQTANAAVRQVIVEYINANYDAENDGFTASDLIKAIPELDGKSNQYVSQILRQAILAKELSKHTVKRRTYFTAYNPDWDVEEVEG